MDDLQTAAAIYKAYKKSGLPCDGAKLVADIRNKARQAALEEAARTAEMHEHRGEIAEAIRNLGER